MDQFWLTDEQFARIAPHLPTDTRGKPRADDRRVISGIIHVLKSDGRWVDAPAAYGPRKTLYNRFVRWAASRRNKAALSPTMSSDGLSNSSTDPALGSGLITNS